MHVLEPGVLIGPPRVTLVDTSPHFVSDLMGEGVSQLGVFADAVDKVGQTA